MRPHLNLPRPDLSAAQFAGLGLLGVLITEAIFLAPLPSLMHLGLFLGFLVGMVPVALGLGLYIWAITEIKNGVQNGIWTDNQLAPLRRITLSPYSTAIVFALLAVFLAFTLFNLANHANRSHRAWGWAAYLFLMFITQLQMATKQPTAKTTGPLIDWRTRAPIQSDHWGER